MRTKMQHVAMMLIFKFPHIHHVHPLSLCITVYIYVYMYILMSYMSSQTGEKKRTNKNQLNPITKIHKTHPNTMHQSHLKSPYGILRVPTSFNCELFQVANVLVIAEASDVVYVILFRMQSISYSMLKYYIICICILYRL